MTIDNAFYQRIIETCFPDIQVLHIQFLGGGTCRVFAVNQTLIFRFPHGGGSVVSDGLVEDEGVFLWHEKERIRQHSVTASTAGPALPLL